MKKLKNTLFSNKPVTIDENSLIMAIESSCDETACAIVKGGREVLANVVASQIKIHEEFGGVIPEIAAREHLEAVNVVVDEAFKQAGVSANDITAFAGTVGPGLVGCLLVGLNATKSLALAYDKPFIGINHLNAHISANFIDTNLEPPFIALLVSGGHTQIIDVKSYSDLEIIGETIDDAVGEAYDKVARVVGVGYPGGPIIDKMASQGVPVYPLPHIKLSKDSLDFSFSGLKSAVINLCHNANQRGETIDANNLAASFQTAVIDVLVSKTSKAATMHNVKQVIIAGGVAANKGLRCAMKDAMDELNIKLTVPQFKYCTDNAAMIAAAGYYKYIKEQKN